MIRININEYVKEFITLYWINNFISARNRYLLNIQSMSLLKYIWSQQTVITFKACVIKLSTCNTGMKIISLGLRLLFPPCLCFYYSLPLYGSPCSQGTKTQVRLGLIYKHLIYKGGKGSMKLLRTFHVVHWTICCPTKNIFCNI
jgi:hypothetical protein